MDNRTLKKAVEHIKYEISVLNYSFDELLKNPDGNKKNLLIDGFVLHARNLFEFFYPKNDARKYPDDMLWFDYIKQLKLFKKNRIKRKDVKFNLKKAHKQLAHLSYKRNIYINQLNKKSWPIGIIHNNLNRTYQIFLDSLSDARKEWFR